MGITEFKKKYHVIGIKLKQDEIIKLRIEGKELAEISWIKLKTTMFDDEK